MRRDTFARALWTILVCTLGLALALLPAGCGGGGTQGGPHMDAGDAEAAEHVGDVPTDLEIPEGFDLPELLDGVQPCPAGKGCLGDPCDENTDCLSGYCVEHMGEKVCTQLCEEECPAGWKCTSICPTCPDPVFACASEFPFLCMPCQDDADCSAAWGGAEICAWYGPQGAFCGGACGEGVACPAGFTCKEVPSLTSGVASFQCVADSGECDCGKTATKLSLATVCEQGSQYGVCKGSRTCTENGLADCDAAMPVEEVCNGEDDDCDGKTDEVDCDDGNPCTEDSCDPATGCQSEPLSGVECSDGDACTGSDFCQDGTCSGVPVSCDDENPCTDDMCDKIEGCKHQDNTLGCDDGEPCTVGDKCFEGKCAGTPVECDCATSEDCTKLEDGNLCNGTLLCDQGKVPYQCKVDPVTIVACPAPEGIDAFCLKAECDPAAGTCQTVPDHEGLACADGDLCTLGDLCVQGKCTGQMPAQCDDGNVCTDDACDSKTGCTHVANALACDDANACTEGDHCDAGKCVPAGLVSCDDGNVCTTDTCSPLAGCGHEMNALPCTDGDECTAPDLCANGACVSGGPVDCDDDNVCTDDSCDPAAGCVQTPNAAACDDGNSCTLGDHCAGGKCVPEGVIECDDGNVCTDDVCDLAGGCQHVNNVKPCDDADACTKGDLCANAACVPGQPVACNDKNVCTDDSCEPAEGCVYTPNAAACDDGNKCTSDDVCADGKCLGATPIDCDDGNVCTTDTCDPLKGCIYTFNTAPCDDANACTMNDMCKKGECTGGPNVTCNDGNTCTDDACDPDEGCVFAPNGNLCDDGNKCTTNDQCSGGWCTGGSTLDCDDGNVCTNDYCKPVSGCWYANNSAPCDDGDMCSVGDICQAGLCNPGPGKLKCEDGDKCTSDVCEPLLGCVFPIIIPCCGNGLADLGEACDDGNNESGDGCSADCKSDESCGNGILDPDSEACDGIVFPASCNVGYFTCKDQCQTWDTSACQSWCGDGLIDAKYEVCDGDVFPSTCYEGQFECLLGCKIWDKSNCLAWCGDGIANGPEECDGGDFLVPCPLAQCYCSSDCKLYVDEEEGALDWASGVFDGVSNNPKFIPDPLCANPDNVCLDSTTTELKHIWIGNSESHEVVRINVDTGAVEKEIPSLGQHPSRTAVVVKDGSVWVGNRGWNCYNDPNCSNLVHFDINGNTVCKVTVLGMVRAVGIDQDGNVWAGSWVNHKAYKVSGTEVDATKNPPVCKILAEVGTAGCPYGMVGDAKGNLWVSNNCAWANSFDPATESVQAIDIKTNTAKTAKVPPQGLAGCYSSYGITVDAQGRVIVGSYACYGLFRYTPDTNGWEWIATPGAARGVVVDQDGYIYTALSNGAGGDMRHISRVAPDFKSVSTLDLGGGITHPVGVAIDHNGWLWTAGRNSNTCARVEIAKWGNSPKVNTFPTNGTDPYTYSDMTGFQHLMFTNPEGTWTKDLDGGADKVYWKLVEWSGVTEAGVTKIEVRARAAATQATLQFAGWTNYFATSPGDLTGLPNLRWLQVQVKLSSTDPVKSPVLQKVKVHWTK